MRLLFLSAAFIVASNFFAQEKFCGATEAQNNWFLNHPEEKAAFDKLQQQASNTDKEQFKNGYQQRTTAASNYTIPVVFHILHQGGSENISDAQIQDAISIITRDYNKQNADTSVVVPQFTNLIGNVKFNFQLATIDPNGNCTNGIIRHWDPKTVWQNSFTDYIYTWPPSKYLNVYVVKSMLNGFAGYTYLPGSGIPTAADAIVVLSTYVGSIGTSNTNQSRTLTHEAGHWFNLQHVWGSTNQPGVACGDDGVTDTPQTKGYTTCALANSMICNSGVTENVQNYMEYSYCSKMFTLGQVTRVTNAINSTTNGRNNLSTPANLLATGINSVATNCIPLINISVLPSATICSGYSLSLVSYTSNANPTSYSWTATSGATIANPSAANTAITFNTVGTVTVNCVAATSSGSNNQSVVVTVLNGTTEVSSANVESFEGATLPNFWATINPTSATYKWDATTDAASDGSKSMYIAGENFPANAIAILESPSYDFLNNQGALYTFDYAYAKYSATNKDLFKVQASKDCGGSWNDIWVPTTSGVATGSGGTSSTLFIPTASQWVNYDLTAHPNFLNFLNYPNVLIRFYFQEDVGGTGNGNRMYLDKINFSTPVGINELTKSISLSVYPNPTAGVFTLGFNLSDAAKIKYQLTSVTGAVILAMPEQQLGTGIHELKINENNKLAQGIYFLNFELNGTKMSRKIIIN